VLLELLELDDDCVPSLLVCVTVGVVLVMTQFDMPGGVVGAAGAGVVTTMYLTVTGCSTDACACGSVGAAAASSAAWIAAASSAA
jgi:hypothetical protein